MSYPVSLTVVPQIANRNRLTNAFRLLLALPHIILVGAIAGELWSAGSHSILSIGGTTGILGAVASLLAIISWFTIVLSGEHVQGIREITMLVLRWRARAIGYVMLLVDEYPPFGDGPYPVTLTIVDPPPRRPQPFDGRLPAAARDSPRDRAVFRGVLLVGPHDHRLVRDSADRPIPGRPDPARDRRDALGAARRGLPAAARGRVPAVFIRLEGLSHPATSARLKPSRYTESNRRKPERYTESNRRKPERYTESNRRKPERYTESELAEARAASPILKSDAAGAGER
ncbi:MAG TPA: DUF4389 domain-containing protein, partial [Vicinamibacterales bacterium]|nr:DUF4389 domain-containing protein [Vicinamibacterales bacterium]